MHKIFYYYGIYCFCLAIHDGLHEALDRIGKSTEQMKKEAGEPSIEKERRIKPKEHYNAKGEPMAKIGF